MIEKGIRTQHQGEEPPPSNRPARDCLLHRYLPTFTLAAIRYLIGRHHYR